jgi:hypothetical protein
MATLRRQMRWGDGIQNGGDHRPRDDKRRTVLGIAALVRGKKVKPTAPCCVFVAIIRSCINWHNQDKTFKTTHRGETDPKGDL